MTPPTYAYECDECSRGYDVFQKITSKQIRKCKLCGANKLRRVITGGAGILFKGSGWPGQDIKRKGGKNEDTKENAS